MPYRGYVVKNKKGKRVAMRDSDLFSTKQGALKNIKKETKEWTDINYGGMMGDYEFGAYEVGKKGYKFKKGQEGNMNLLKYHDKKHGKNCNCGCNADSFLRFEL